MRSIRVILLGCLFSVVHADEVHTLYGPIPTDLPQLKAPKLSLSPLGVGADGETTYLWKNIVSETPVVNPTGTEIIGYSAIPVTTEVGTIIANDKHIRFSAVEGKIPVTVNEECNFGPDGGSCIQTVLYNPRLNGPPETTTQVTTFTGLLAPYYTITVKKSGSEPTQGSNGDDNGANPVQVSFGSLALLLAIIQFIL